MKNGKDVELLKKEIKTRRRINLEAMEGESEKAGMRKSVKVKKCKSVRSSL